MEPIACSYLSKTKQRKQGKGGNKSPRPPIRNVEVQDGAGITNHRIVSSHMGSLVRVGGEEGVRVERGESTERPNSVIILQHNQNFIVNNNSLSGKTCTH